MVRVLTFADDDVSRERFRQLYNGIVTGAFLASQERRDSRDRRTLDDAEREAEIHEVFEAVSEVDEDFRTGTGEDGRRLKTAPAEIRLKQPVLDTIKKFMELWIPSPACASTNTRKAVDALHFLKAAPEDKASA